MKRNSCLLTFVVNTLLQLLLFSCVNDSDSITSGKSFDEICEVKFTKQDDTAKQAKLCERFERL